MPGTSYRIDLQFLLDLISQLGFSRVVGTEGETRGFQVIAERLAALGVHAWFEAFPTPWIAVDRALLHVGEETLPIQPVTDPLFNGPWLPIPYLVDLQGTLVEPIDVWGPADPIALRTSLDTTEPYVRGASAQVFACAPQEPFVAYYLAEVGLLGRPVPSAYVAPEALPLLRAHLGAPCRMQWTSTHGVRVLRNLVAEVRGTERPSEVIAVGAHLDSFPGTVGADDNASGCARLVAFLRWFEAHPPARTVRAIWFTGEELDRRGSHAYVAVHARDPEQIRLYVNVDGGVSRDHTPFPVDVGDQDAVEVAARGVLERILDPTGRGPFVRADHCSPASDAAPFHAMGIPVAQAPGAGPRKTSGPSPHLPTDTVDRLDPACLRTAGAVALAYLDAAQRHGLAASQDRRR